VGAATGALTGKMTDVGVDDGFLEELGEKLDPGMAAVIVLVHRSTPDKVLPEISRYGGTVLQSSLDDDAEARLSEALQAQGATA
jgi:uncharacterized membrane protein